MTTKITKEKFEAYEGVREEGLVNMFDVKSVVALSDGELEREDVLDIMENYGKYKEKWGDE